MAAAAKTEPKLEAVVMDPPAAGQSPSMTAPQVVGVAIPAASPAEAAPSPEPLARIEDKTARIEEKFARAEERMMRVESALEKATMRLEGASQDMNLQGVKDDIARLREQVGGKPGAATIFIVALVAALIGAGVSFALTRFGIPGLIR
jgi:hypothetical protein